MLNNKSTTFYVKRYSMTNVYLSVAESQDLVRNLTTGEFMLYTTVKGMVLEKPTAGLLKTPELASRLKIAEKTLSNVKASLKKKGYLIITFGKDGDGDLTAQVYIGKDQVTLYNLGLKVEISDARAYKELTDKFDILSPTLTKLEREEAVKAANQYYMNSIK